MLKKIALVVLCLGLASCAASQSPPAACTNLISNSGGILKFCQTNDKIAITETGLANPRGKDLIVDDLRALAALERHLRLNANLKRSRAIVKRACVVNGEHYVNVRASDLDRLVGTNRLNRSSVPQ